MGFRFLKTLRISGYAIVVAIAIVPAATRSAAGQSSTTAAAKAKPAAAKKTWTQLRTSDGQPDLQGIWSNATTTHT